MSGGRRVTNGGGDVDRMTRAAAAAAEAAILFPEHDGDILREEGCQELARFRRRQSAATFVLAFSSAALPGMDLV